MTDQPPPPPARLLHLIETPPADDPYTPRSLDVEGFVHCSADEPQALAVADRFYPDADTLVMIVIDTARLHVPVRMERGADRPNEWFPHVFGPIPHHAIIDHRPLQRTAHGWRLP